MFKGTDMKNIRNTARIRHVVATFALALVYIACTNDEIPVTQADDSYAVGFVPSVEQPPTRAVAADKNTLPATGFKALAFQTGTDSWASASATATPGFMYYQTVTWNNGAWTYSPVKYWPGKVDGTNYGKITFFGYAPATANAAMSELSAETDVGAPAFTFTVPNENAKQYDLSVDVLVDQTYLNGNVKFNFNHLLSRIGFTAALSDNYVDATVKVTSLKVKYAGNKVRNKGRYTFGAADHAVNSWVMTGADVSAMSTTGEGDEVASTEQPALGASPVSVTGNDRFLMLMPQTVAAGDLTVDVTWTVTSGQGDNQSVVSNRKTVSLSATTWEQGMGYAYQLNFSLTDVTFGGVAVTPWDGILSYKQITITYKANDGSDEETTRSAWTNHVVKIIDNPFTPPIGKSLAAWTTLPDGTGISYAPGQEVSGTDPLSPVDDLTLYAQWQ
jgi:hypothetical protein